MTITYVVTGDDGFYAATPRRDFSQVKPRASDLDSFLVVDSRKKYPFEFLKPLSKGLRAETFSAHGYGFEPLFTCFDKMNKYCTSNTSGVVNPVVLAQVVGYQSTAYYGCPLDFIVAVHHDNYNQELKISLKVVFQFYSYDLSNKQLMLPFDVAL